VPPHLPPLSLEPLAYGRLALLIRLSERWGTPAARAPDSVGPPSQARGGQAEGGKTLAPQRGVPGSRPEGRLRPSMLAKRPYSSAFFYPRRRG
jgi:hypothetical protein